MLTRQSNAGRLFGQTVAEFSRPKWSGSDLGQSSDESSNGDKRKQPIVHTNDLRNNQIHVNEIFNYLLNNHTKLSLIWLSFRNRDPRLQRPAASASYILAIGSGQRILYRLGSGLWLVPVLVLRRSRFLNDSHDFFKVSSKTTIKRKTGAEKPQICTIFRAKSQTISAVDW